jgi:hypothetical protein
MFVKTHQVKNWTRRKSLEDNSRFFVSSKLSQICTDANKKDKGNGPMPCWQSLSIGNVRQQYNILIYCMNVYSYVSSSSGHKEKNLLYTAQKYSM